MRFVLCTTELRPFINHLARRAWVIRTNVTKNRLEISNIRESDGLWCSHLKAYDGRYEFATLKMNWWLAYLENGKPILRHETLHLTIMQVHSINDRNLDLVTTSLVLVTSVCYQTKSLTFTWRHSLGLEDEYVIVLPDFKHVSRTKCAFNYKRSRAESYQWPARQSSGTYYIHIASTNTFE